MIAPELTKVFTSRTSTFEAKNLGYNTGESEAILHLLMLMPQPTTFSVGDRDMKLFATKIYATFCIIDIFGNNDDVQFSSFSQKSLLLLQCKMENNHRLLKRDFTTKKNTSFKSLT